ncbi:daple-like protein [Stylophora pistillata]|uniref:daple-like protein n=1 Tax=Stylophora pistillata TaxID=50429 RepID=UPI000C042307|nr:daple-like protein [Stylophora pistillata]
MSTSWISFLYKHITGEEENERASSSLDVLSKANIWIKDLPTNNLEPLEESFGARRMKMKGKKEMELQLGKKMTVLEQQYLDREKELIKKNSALENELRESREKMNDLRIQQEKDNDALKTEIKDLKETLVIREQRHKKQKELLKKKETNAQTELNKARAVISNLSEGMMAREATLSVSKETISEKEEKIKQLTSQKETYKNVVKTMTADIRHYNKQLQRATDDVDKIREKLEFCRADNSQLVRQNNFLQNQVEELKENLKKTSDDNQKQMIEMETTVVNAETKLKELSEVNSKLVKQISFLQNEDKQMQFDLHENRNRERLEEKLEMINQLNRDLNKTYTEATVEILAGVYDDLQLTQLDVSSWAYFLPEQKNPLLIKETKGDEANEKKTEKVKEYSEPRPSMLSSATSDSMKETLVPDTCLRKRHRCGQNKGFSCKSKTADLLTMPTAGGPIKLHQAPLSPVFTSLSTSDVGRVKKDDDWLDRNQENFVPFSQKELQQLATTNSALKQQVNQLLEELVREKGAARRNYFKRSELMHDLNVIVTKKQAEWTTAILTGGFDYDSDRALNERHSEGKDEKYFAKKGNSSFEVAKEECPLQDDEKPDDFQEKSDRESSEKKKLKSPTEKGKTSSEAEKAGACRLAEEGNSSSEAAKGNTAITTPATAYEVNNDDWLSQNQGNSNPPWKTEGQGFFGNMFWGLYYHASSNL